MTRFRRIVTRYECKARNFLAFCKLASLAILLRQPRRREKGVGALASLWTRRPLRCPGRGAGAARLMHQRFDHEPSHSSDVCEFFC
jgi:hypothetical protein